MNVSVRHGQGTVSHQPHQQQEVYLGQIKVPPGLVNLHSLLGVVRVCVCACARASTHLYGCSDKTRLHTCNWRLSHLHTNRDLSWHGCDFHREFSYYSQQYNNKQVCVWWLVLQRCGVWNEMLCFQSHNFLKSSMSHTSRWTYLSITAHHMLQFEKIWEYILVLSWVPTLDMGR